MYRYYNIFFKKTRKHCRPCAKHAHDTGVRAHTCLHGLFSVEHSYQPGTFQCTSSCNNTLRCRWVHSKNEQITSCLASDRQHAPRTRQHCRPCGMHAHDTEVRARTCLHGLFSVEHSYQPGTFQCTSSCNNTLRCRWVRSTTTQITSCLRSDGQHAPRTQIQCRPCGIHARDTGVRAHTCLHGLF